VVRIVEITFRRNEMTAAGPLIENELTYVKQAGFLCEIQDSKKRQALCKLQV
jgi:hypothetical protein